MKADLNLLPVFLILLEERSVTRAASRLGMTQPALSNALNRLRATFRDPLFIRERYGIRPTELALSLAPDIEAALARLDDLIVARQDFQLADADHLFVVATNGYAELVLIPPLVAWLQAEAPKVRLRLVPFGTNLSDTGVISGTTAMALGRMVDPPDNLVVQHLMEDGLACVVRAGHPEVRDSISRAQYEQLRHVNVLPPGRLRAGLFQAMETQGVHRNIAVSVTQFSAAPEMIAVSDLCATLPRLLCRSLEQDPRLRVLPAPFDLGTFPVEMAWHTRYRNDPAHKWFRGLVMEIAGKLGA